jgi:aspartate kinase
MQVVKIGGSILKNKEDLILIKQKLMDCHNCIIVTSALKNVTNMLIEAYETENTGIIENIYSMHITITTVPDNIKILLGKFRDELKKLVLMEKNLQLRDLVISYGERMSTILLYSFLRENGFKASYIIDPLVVTDHVFGNATFMEDRTAERIKNTVFGDITVVPGFYGSTENGEITTVGRGGSDYTAMIFASILNCNVRIITDVPGIMTSDPRVFSDSRTLPEVSLSEVLKMSHFGVKNFNYKTFTPVIGRDMDITVESLYEEGVTRITKKPVKSVKCVALASYGARAERNLLVFIGHGISDPEVSKNILSVIGHEHLYHMDSLSLSLLLDEDLINNKKCFQEASSWIK